MTDQAPGFYRTRIGRFVVTALNDGMIDLSPDALLGITPADAGAALVRRFLPPILRVTVNAYLIQGDGRTILVDTGGAAMSPSLGSLTTNLAAADVPPEDVDLVLLTHLHGDHAGGLTRPDGSAVFPNAELAVAAAEAGYWLDAEQEAAAPAARQASFRSAHIAVAPYRGRMRLLGTEAVIPGITPVPLPGHTPGHTGYRVEDGNAALLIWGDVMHIPDLQAPQPQLSLIYDFDPVQAHATRQAILVQAAQDRTTIAGMHLHFPGFVHVARDGDGYSLLPTPWSPAV